MFNSALIYELAVLKMYAEPLLFAIDKDCPEYLEAKRLLKFWIISFRCRATVSARIRLSANSSAVPASMYRIALTFCGSTL